MLRTKDTITTFNNSIKIESVPPGYLVWSPQCKMLSLPVLADDVMRLFTKEEYEPCSKKRPLTTIVQNFEEDSVKVVFHRGLIGSSYLGSDQNQIDCCYQEITRGGANATADDKFK